ncbi:MAG: hypothetical protein HYY01_05405 [Chloroflexi bacterium]|nr:hypothetical protein [Chloroflexota bacterium]
MISRLPVFGVVLALLFVAVGATAAVAHFWDGNHWANSAIDYRDIVDNYDTELSSARVDWNLTTNNPTELYDCNCTGGWDIQVGDANYGANDMPGWSGGYLWSELYIDLNEYYMGGYVPNKRRAVITHEFGHAAGGLDHHEEQGRIMQYYVEDYYDTDGLYQLDAGSVGELNDLW